MEDFTFVSSKFQKPSVITLLPLETHNPPLPLLYLWILLFFYKLTLIRKLQVRYKITNSFLFKKYQWVKTMKFYKRLFLEFQIFLWYLKKSGQCLRQATIWGLLTTGNVLKRGMREEITWPNDFIVPQLWIDTTLLISIFLWFSSGSSLCIKPNAHLPALSLPCSIRL